MKLKKKNNNNNNNNNKLSVCLKNQDFPFLSFICAVIEWENELTNLLWFP